MKSLFYFLALALLTSMTVSDAAAPGEPIAGRDVKVGRTPPNGGQIFASTTTDDNGEFVFDNLPKIGKIYFEFDKGIKEQGIKAKSEYARSEYFDCATIYAQATGSATNPTANSAATSQAIVRNYGNFDVTFRFEGSTVRGTVVTSRSNIKK